MGVSLLPLTGSQSGTPKDLELENKGKGICCGVNGCVDLIGMFCFLCGAVYGQVKTLNNKFVLFFFNIILGVS